MKKKIKIESETIKMKEKFSEKKERKEFVNHIVLQDINSGIAMMFSEFIEIDFKKKKRKIKKEIVKN